jgi:hypothetical protein
MPARLWVITGLCAWIGSLLFAAFGLFIGYLLPSENVTQVIALARDRRCLALAPRHRQGLIPRRSPGIPIPLGLATGRRRPRNRSRGVAAHGLAAYA